MTDRIEHAKIVAQSSLIPAEYRGKPADIVWAMDIGDALGVPYTQVMQSMVVARGKMTMSADLMGAVVRRAGHKLRLREDGDSVTADLIRSDDPDYKFTVTWDKAKAQAAGASMDDPDSLSAVIDKWESGVNADPQEER